jgi:hypothetical protein
MARLESHDEEERVRAADALADLGSKGRPAARALCEAALDPSEQVSHAALRALEKVHPDLYEPVLILRIDENALNHRQALLKLGQQAEQAKPALPVLFHRIKKCQEQLTGVPIQGLRAQAAWGQPTLVQIIDLLMQTLPKVAPEDPEVVQFISELTKLSLPSAVQLQDPHWRTTKTPFRDDGLRLLGKLAQGHPAHRKQIIPTLVSVLEETRPQTNANEEPLVVDAIRELDLTTDALLNCGPEAKQTLAKEALPKLKDLQFNPSANVRKAAGELVRKIETAP